MATASAAVAVDDAPYAEWRAELAVWLQALRTAKIRIDLPPLPTVSDIEELWIEVKTPQGDANTRAGWTPFIEALELMELLARVDLCAAWYLLLELTGQQQVVTQYKTLLFNSGVLPKFVIKVEDAVLFHKQTFRGLERLIAKNTTIWTAAYLPVKDKLQAKWSEQHDGEELDRELHGRVKLSIDFEVLTEFDSDVAITAALEPITRLAYAHYNPSAIKQRPARGSRPRNAPVVQQADSTATEDESSPVERGFFTMVSFRYNLGFAVPAVTNLVLYLVNQAAKFIRISHFVIAHVYREQLHQSTIGDFLLNQLVPWQPRVEGHGLHELRLDGPTLDAAAVRAFCTSIVSSKQLKELVVAQHWIGETLPHEARSNVWWPWLVYALFSREASHNIHTVTISMDLLDDDSNPGSPADVLQRRDPLAYLLQLQDNGMPTELDAADHDSVDTPVAARFNEEALIRIGRHAETDPDTAEPEAALTVREPGVSFRVTRNQPEEDFLEFLFPGMGICWTERHNLLELTPVQQREAHPVRHLTLKYLEEYLIVHASDLLEVVGESIEWLTIDGMEGVGSTALLDAVAAFCPNLKRLDIRESHIDTLSWFADPHDSLFKLETLCLDDPVVDDVPSWSVLFSALKDPTHPLAQSLRELHLGVQSSPMVVRPITNADELFGEVLSMLESNRHLIRCDLWTDIVEMMTKYEAAVLSHHGDYIPEEDSPMTPAQKMAFLGVITQTRKTSSQGDSPQRKLAKLSERKADSARFKINPETVKLVFDYAATAKARVCGMQVPPKKY